MRDPAAYVVTPAPEGASSCRVLGTVHPDAGLAGSERTEVPTVRLSTVGFAPPEDLSVRCHESRFRPAKPRARRGVAHWPLLVHVLLGIALGAAIVAAYSAYYGCRYRRFPLALRRDSA